MQKQRKADMREKKRAKIETARISLSRSPTEVLHGSHGLKTASASSENPVRAFPSESLIKEKLDLQSSRAMKTAKSSVEILPKTMKPNTPVKIYAYVFSES